MDNQRFFLRCTVAGVRTICDRKDDSIVCLVAGGKRPTEHTDRMIAVMLAALNAAVHRAETPRQEETTPCP